MTDRARLALTALCLAIYAAGYALVRKLGAALILAALCSCLWACKSLGPAGITAVVTRTAVDTTDKACATFLDHEVETLPAYVASAVAACNAEPDPVGCYNGKVGAREKAIGACRAYGEARSSTAARDAAKAALTAIGGAP